MFLCDQNKNREIKTVFQIISYPLLLIFIMIPSISKINNLRGSHFY